MLRLYEQYKQALQQNENSTGSAFPATEDNVWNSSTTQLTTRSDLRALGYDLQTPYATLGTAITTLQNNISSLVNGVNCSLIITKGVNLILDNMCATGAENPTIMSGILAVSFYQMMITLLVMFAVCCS